MKTFLQIINQLADIQQKLEASGQSAQFERNFNKLTYLIEEEGFVYKNPLGEKYNDSRTDCEANIVGREGKHMIITQVLKPIIYKKDSSGLSLVQKALVIVENRK